MIEDIKSILSNLPGWRTNRKILVIESDDWGSIRMQSPQAYRSLLKRGFKVDECHYNKYDMLESNDDIDFLANELIEHKDKNGRSLKFTLNNVVGNPDFNKIEGSDFLEYYYEPFTKTLEGYPNHNKVYDKIKEGESSKVFSVQFHGREHVNVDNWINNLKHGDETARIAFEYNMFSAHKDGSLTSPRSEYLDTYGLGYNNVYVDHSESVLDGLNLFDSTWKKKSFTMIAPTYVWDDIVEKESYLNGVRLMQGFRVQLVPDQKSKTGVKVKRVYTGRKSKTGIVNLMRNVYFEPSSDSKFDWIDHALNSIDIAFRLRKPAILASHRVNYMGGLEVKNRSNNLQLLNKLIYTALRKYPDIEFMSSDELGGIICDSSQSY